RVDTYSESRKNLCSHECGYGRHECPRHIAAAFLPMLLLLAGCRQDMHDQPKYKPLRHSNFFEDGRTSRPLVPGTVARGELHEDVAFYTGKNGKDDLDAFPIQVDKAVIERGRQRFNIYCSPCHGEIGNGLGMIVRRGFKQPPSYHIDRLRKAPVGHFYDVISNGYGAMLNYAQQIEARDRWAIVAYIRALQYSQNANVAELSPEERAQLPAPGTSNATPANPTVPQVNDQRNFPARPAVPPSVRQGKRQ
ncbi:MAG: c-type cytochrome, partial [Bryobacteraceae bacterium]